MRNICLSSLTCPHRTLDKERVIPLHRGTSQSSISTAIVSAPLRPVRARRLQVGGVQSSRWATLGMGGTPLGTEAHRRDQSPLGAKEAAPLPGFLTVPWKKTLLLPSPWQKSPLSGDQSAARYPSRAYSGAQTRAPAAA